MWNRRLPQPILPIPRVRVPQPITNPPPENIPSLDNVAKEIARAIQTKQHTTTSTTTSTTNWLLPAIAIGGGLLILAILRGRK